MKNFLQAVMYGSVFAVPFVLLIVSGSMFFPFITGKNFAFRILVEVAFASWFLLALIDKDWRPRLSYILYAVLGLVGVMFVANLLGEYAPKSFWSNYERMEGWVTLLHFSLYFLVLGAALTTEKLWNRFLNTALFVAIIMSCFALAQAAGTYEISQGGNWRVDGRLGNSTYLGVYMLFHIFISAWLLIRSKTRGGQIFYGVLIALFVYILSQTGTRGAMYGLIGGSILSFLYLAVMAPRGAAIKKWALGGFLAVVMVVVGVYLSRDTEFVKDNPALNRFAGTTLAEGGIRFMVWGMAWEGVKEHPILGWGQENFSYVFNKYYNPSLYGAEPWYDRTHNIFLDWLIAGGVLGLLAYLLVLLSALWYAVLVPFGRRFSRREAVERKESDFTLTYLFIAVADIFSVFLASLFLSDYADSIKKADEEKESKSTTQKKKESKEPAFTVNEQALLLGLLAAYMFHNLFVFDNLGSWIFYAVVLALVHSRVAKEWKGVNSFKINQDTWNKVMVPSVSIVMVLVIYFVNIPSMLAAQNVIDGYRVTEASGRVDMFAKAYERGGFASQEIFEQFSQVGAQILNAQGLSEQDRTKVMNLFEEMRRDMMASKEGDARLHIIAANFYRSATDLNKAMDNLNIAESLSPTKQAIKEDQGIVYMMAGKPEEAVDRFLISYELDTTNVKALTRLAAAYLFADQKAEFNELVGPDKLEANPSLLNAYVTEPLVVQIAYQKRDYEVLEYVMKKRTEFTPSDKSAWTNLAALHFEQGEFDEAEAVVREAMAVMPEFRTEGEQLLKEIESVR